MKILASVVVCFATLVTGPANAKIIAYSFTGSVYGIFEFSNSGASRPEESTYAGSTVRNGQRVNGYFEYDTAAPTEFDTEGAPLGHQSYSGGAFMSLRFENNGPQYSSDRDTSGSGRSVSHNHPNQDSFQISTVGMDTVRFATGNVAFLTGTTGGGIPPSLDSSNVNGGRFMYTFARNNGDGTLLVVSGEIDSLTELSNTTAVPEPASLPLLLVGALGLALRGRRSR